MDAIPADAVSLWPEVSAVRAEPMRDVVLLTLHMADGRERRVSLPIGVAVETAAELGRATLAWRRMA